ncbi:LemA family protein [Longimicrobium sp.]|uniref:LemA family protein n=1 Tax=Longimicrobium sp. TaxID=2029185 RepID=UPI002B658B5F|nr:LemA family protein [Longimicrobium sp.]HSU16419.1 LemA family protein [Longimicrobium sp.]
MRQKRMAVAAAALSLALGGCGYNQIQQLDETAEQAKSNIGVELTARNQLIPNLVATVKGAAGFERGTYTDVARARAGQLANAEAGLNQARAQTQTAVESKDVNQLQQAEQAQTRAIGTYLNIAVEAYPNLRATQNFTALQDQLAESENRIAVARRDYNEAVRNYNTYIRQFPQAITAKVTGAQRKVPYQAPAGSEQAPTVNFGDSAK